MAMGRQPSDPATLLILYCSTYCLRGHYEQRLVSAAWMQPLQIGKMITWIYHPAIYRTEYVCDECAPEEKTKDEKVHTQE